jgi:ABC-type transport system involved in cytochrome bd biosynthesis fused ATPase/permease subunit
MITVLRYAKADVYVFDDVLSAVDPAVGKHLFSRAIQPLTRTATVVLATHRYDTDTADTTDTAGLTEPTGTTDPTDTADNADTTDPTATHSEHLLPLADRVVVLAEGKGVVGVGPTAQVCVCAYVRVCVCVSIRLHMNCSLCS